MKVSPSAFLTFRPRRPKLSNLGLKSNTQRNARFRSCNSMFATQNLCNNIRCPIVFITYSSALYLKYFVCFSKNLIPVAGRGF